MGQKVNETITYRNLKPRSSDKQADPEKNR